MAVLIRVGDSVIRFEHDLAILVAVPHAPSATAQQRPLETHAPDTTGHMPSRHARGSMGNTDG